MSIYVSVQAQSRSILNSEALDGLVQTPPISDSFLSDYCTVLSELTLRMPATTVKEVCYRKTKAIDIEAFKDDLRKSRLCQDPPVVLTDLVSCYGSTMTSLLDKHAPLQKKTITVRPPVPWFNNEIKEAKRLRTRNERIWRRTGLESDRVKFIKARNHTNHVIEQARRDYYFNLINENDCDQRKLFKTASALLGGSSQEQYPKHSDPAMLARDFGRLHKRSMTFVQSWIELTPHQISLTTRPGVESKSTRMLAHLPLTSSLYRLKVSKNWC